MPDVVVICGLSCVGKTLAGSILSAKFALRHVEASQFMREIWAREAPELPLDEFARRLLSRDPTRVPTAILERFGTEGLIISGLRSPQEIKKLVEFGKSVCVLFIHASLAKRLTRCRDRARDGYPRTASELRALDRIHEDMGLADLEKLPDVRFLRNEDAIETYQCDLIATVS